MQESILTTLVLPVALALIMLGLGLSLKSDDFLRIFKYPKAVTIGLIGQLIILPVIALAIVTIIPMPTAIAGGINYSRPLSMRCIIKYDYLFGWWGCGIGCHADGV